MAVHVHTSTASSVGVTNQPHNIEIQLGSGSTHVASMHSTPNWGHAPSTIGTAGAWRLNIHGSSGFNIPTSTCVHWQDITSISMVASNNDGWLIDYVLILLRGEHGGFRWFSFNTQYHNEGTGTDGRWIDGDATTSQTGGSYDASRWDLTIRANYCH